MSLVLVLVSILLICESNDLSRQTNCVFSTRGGDGTRERKVEKTVDLTIICHARFSLSLSLLLLASLKATRDL